MFNCRAKQSASHKSLALAQAGVVVLENDGNVWRSDLHYRHTVRKNPVKHRQSDNEPHKRHPDLIFWRF